MLLRVGGCVVKSNKLFPILFISININIVYYKTLPVALILTGIYYHSLSTECSTGTCTADFPSYTWVCWFDRDSTKFSSIVYSAVLVVLVARISCCQNDIDDEYSSTDSIASR